VNDGEWEENAFDMHGRTDWAGCELKEGIMLRK